MESNRLLHFICVSPSSSYAVLDITIVLCFECIVRQWIEWILLPSCAVEPPNTRDESERQASNSVRRLHGVGSVRIATNGYPCAALTVRCVLLPLRCSLLACFGLLSTCYHTVNAAYVVCSRPSEYRGGVLGGSHPTTSKGYIEYVH